MFPHFRKWVPVILIAVGLAVYANSLTGPFIFDDSHGITENKSIRQLWPLGEALVPPPNSGMAGRPVVNLSFALNYAVGGYEVFGYHVVNLAIHLLVGLTLWGVLQRARVGVGAAFWATLIWLVHPLLTESVVYLSQRTEMLMGLFFLLTFYCFLRSLDSARAGLWRLATVAACGTGMGCKEVMAVAPVLVLAYDYVFVSGDLRKSWRERRGLYLGLAATWLMVPLLMGGVAMLAKLGHTGVSLSSWDYAKMQCVILVRYLRLCFWPSDLLLDYHGWPAVDSVREIIPQGLFIVGAVVVAVWGTVRRSWWGFLGLWFFVILAPTSSFLPLGLEVGAERRMYLPAMAVVVLVVVTVDHFLRSRPAQWAGIGLAVGVTGVLGWATWARNDEYSTSVRIWSDTVAKAPRNSRALTNWGIALKADGRKAEAEAAYRRALASNGKEWPSWFYYAELLAEDGRTNQAVVCYRQVAALIPSNAPVLAKVGAELAKLDRLPEAVEVLEQVTRVDPESSLARFNLGLLFVRLGQTNAARAQLTEALRLNPQSAVIRAVLEELGP